MATYATWNPADKYTDIALSGGDLTASIGAYTASVQSVRATQGKSTGKWYFEIKCISTDYSNDRIGICNSSQALQDSDIGANQYGWGMAYAYGYHAGGYITGANIGAGNYLCIALDLDAHKLWYGKNGTWMDSGDPGAGTGAQYTDVHAETLYPALSIRAAYGGSFQANFGASAFSYTVPSGFNEGWYEDDGPPPVEADIDEDFTLDDTASWEYTPAPGDTISEDFSLSDAFTAEYMGESTSEDFSLSDSIDGDTYSRATSENITFSDNLSAPGSTYSTQLSEAMSFSDSMLGGSDIQAPMSESLSLSDVMTGLLLADSLSDSFSMSDTMEADELIWIKNTFPNLSGKHLTLKFAPSGSALYFMRMKLFKSDDRVDFDARHPNLSGHHLTLKVSHSANEDFTLAYASMGLFGHIE